MNNMQDEYPFLLVCDVQPGFHSGCHEILQNVVDKINATDQNIIYFYVGKSLDMDSKYDVIAYLLENGVDEYKIDGMRFIEKGYGYFRGWMDNGVNDAITLRAIEQMIKTQRLDTREFTEEDWQVVTKGKHYSVLDTDPIFYPDFPEKMFKMNGVDGFEMIGGGRNECLKELELYLQAHGKKLTVNEDLCYGAWISAKKKFGY